MSQPRDIKAIKKILLIQLGDIGDVVWTTPTLRAVKNTRPEVEVSILVREGFGGLLQADPHIHRVFEAGRRKGGGLLREITRQARLVRALRAERFDLVFDLRAGDRGAFMTWMTGAPVRVSLHYDDVPCWRNLLFTHIVNPPPPARKVRGAAEQSLRIVRQFGFDSDDIAPRLWVAGDVGGKVREMLRRAGLDPESRWISINPFSRWRYKEWNDRKWAQIVNWLWGEYCIASAIVGSSDEKERAAALLRGCHGKHFDFTGRTSLAELAALLDMSFLHLGVDSAAPHIAAAVGTPTAVIYGPSDWWDWAPPGPAHRVILPDTDCSPCYRKGCEDSGTSRCLEELSVDKVKGVIKELLGKTAEG